MSIQTETKITVFADEDYCYEVINGETLEISYIESTDQKSKSKIYISFGSKDEMKAVAEAMLKVLEY